ncbi:MAG: glycosyltransferase, partial [Treponema sp.]|nr:glycosyltransferase [Treponema sp.]
PYVDKLFYKSIFSDRKDYLKNLYGKNLFAEYYHKQFGINDSPEYISRVQLSEEDVKKPELSWNIGLGTYPRWNWPQRLGAVLARSDMPVLGQVIGGKPLGKAILPGSGKLEKAIDFSGSGRSIAIHARIDPVTCPSIAYQRVLLLKIISELPQEKQSLFLTGTVSQKQYYSELLDSKIVLSPFGWGEVCFRDFEAILAGALLLKPDMSHLVTKPNVYIPYETYVPIKWDGSDLLEQSERFLNDDKERLRITGNAYEQYKNETASVFKQTDQLLGEYYS